MKKFIKQNKSLTAALAILLVLILAIFATTFSPTKTLIENMFVKKPTPTKQETPKTPNKDDSRETPPAPQPQTTQAPTATVGQGTAQPATTSHTSNPLPPDVQKAIDDLKNVPVACNATIPQQYQAERDQALLGENIQHQSFISYYGSQNLADYDQMLADENARHTAKVNEINATYNNKVAAYEAANHCVY